jgi:hypothetical protein
MILRYALAPSIKICNIKLRHGTSVICRKLIKPCRLGKALLYTVSILMAIAKIGISAQISVLSRHFIQSYCLGIALLNTKTLPIHVYTALQAIGGTPYDKFNRADAFEADGKTPKTGAMLGEDAQKINVSFVSGDKTYEMADFFDHVVTPTKEIVSADTVEVEPYVADMRFGGCIENVMAEQYINSPAGNQTGCITCTFSCWIGTVSNGEYGYNTQESKVNRANVPAANTPVTVVYTLGE